MIKIISTQNNKAVNINVFTKLVLTGKTALLTRENNKIMHMELTQKNKHNNSLPMTRFDTKRNQVAILF